MARQEKAPALRAKATVKGAAGAAIAHAAGDSEYDAYFQAALAGVVGYYGCAHPAGTLVELADRVARECQATAAARIAAARTARAAE